MFRLVKVNNHRALVFGPIFDRTFYLGYNTIDDNVFSYHLNVYREEDGISYCSWSLQFQHQLQARPTLMPAPFPSKSVLTLPLQIEDAQDEEKTDPKMVMVTEIKPKPTIIVEKEVSDYINPKHNRPFQVGDWIKIRDTHSDYRAVFYRPLKQDDERGWYVSDLDNSATKYYVEYFSHNAEWQYSDAVKADKSKPKPKTSTAMVVASTPASAKVPTKLVPKFVEKDDPVVEEVYPLETSNPLTGSSFLSFSETASDLMPAELQSVQENPVKVGPIKDYFPKPTTLISAKEEFDAHGSIAIRQPHPLLGFSSQVCGSSWTPKAGQQIIIPFKDAGGHWRMTINQDDDGYYVETDDENKISIFFDPERGLWAIGELI